MFVTVFHMHVLYVYKKPTYKLPLHFDDGELKSPKYVIF
jgi:hypothetical protein